MSKEEQKLVGYIVYDIWTFNTSSDKGQTWEKQVIYPEVHWNKKIYTSYASAENAVKDIVGKNNIHKAVIVPVYANRTDLNTVQQTWKELKDEVGIINKNQNKDE
jgi:hypothetical protein